VLLWKGGLRVPGQAEASGSERLLDVPTGVETNPPDVLDVGPVQFEEVFEGEDSSPGQEPPRTIGTHIQVLTGG